MSHKHSSICGISVLPLSGAVVSNSPGDDRISIRGNWQQVAASEIEFSEKESDSSPFFESQLKFRVTDTSPSSEAALRDLSNRYVLLRLHYTDGAVRVLGTDQFPVELTLSREGIPSYFSLSYKGSQPERVKFFQSFP